MLIFFFTIHEDTTVLSLFFTFVSPSWIVSIFTHPLTTFREVSSVSYSPPHFLCVLSRSTYPFFTSCLVYANSHYKIPCLTLRVYTDWLHTLVSYSISVFPGRLRIHEVRHECVPDPSIGTTGCSTTVSSFRLSTAEDELQSVTGTSHSYSNVLRLVTPTGFYSLSGVLHYPLWRL